jgi:hypothetical protein
LEVPEQLKFDVMIGPQILIVTGGVMLAMLLLPRFIRLFGRPLRAGDHIRLSGGYETPAAWLGQFGHIDAEVLRFIVIPGRSNAAVVRMARAISCSDITSDIALLYLRFRDGRWRKSNIVHVELWSHEPTVAEVSDATRGTRCHVESHASYRLLA